MVDVVTVGHNDPMPSEDSDFIQIVRRFDEQNSQRTLIDIDTFVADTGERQSLVDEFKSIERAPLQTIVEQAAAIADQRGIETIYVADLTVPD